MVSTMVDSSLNIYLKKVLEFAETGNQLKTPNSPLEGWLLDIIYQNSRHALAYGYVVNR